MIDMNKIIFAFNYDKNKITHDIINNNSLVIKDNTTMNVDDFERIDNDQRRWLNIKTLKKTKRYHVFFYDNVKNIYTNYFVSSNVEFKDAILNTLAYHNDDINPLEYYLLYIGIQDIDLSNECIVYGGDSFERNLEFIKYNDQEVNKYNEYFSPFTEHFWSQNLPNNFIVLVEVDEEEPPKKEFISQEIGTCDVCGRENVQLARKYYNYDIKCACHSPNHFEIVFYCKNCEPKEPEETTIQFRDERIEGEYKYKTYLVPTKILTKLKGE